MTAQRDIETRTDIETLMRSFYELLLVDEMVGFLFTEVVVLDMDEHLPKLTDFWEDQLLGTNNYSGNPLMIHKRLHDRSALRAEFFDRWLLLFNQTVDTLFSGPKASLAKERAQSIATVMQIKLLY